MNEPMTLRDFSRKVSYFRNLQEDEVSLRTAIRLQKLKTEIRTRFCDRQNNFQRWLNHKPCIFHAPYSENRKQETVVRDDTEAIYCFLLYCMKINQRQVIRDEFAAYVAYVLSICNC